MTVRNPFKRSVAVPGEVARRLPRGERVLAGTRADEGTWLLGTRDALVVLRPDEQPDRIPWERVERADWDRDEERLRVSEVGEFGLPRPEHTFSVVEPGLLLELIRERVTASVVIQRRVATTGRSGLLVIARRAPQGNGEISWAYEFDQGVDPDDPAVMAAAEAGRKAARDEIGV